MKKFIKYSFFTILILSILVVSSSYFIAKAYEKELTASVIGELNKQIETKVDVKDINFSVLRHFPMASLDFDDVFIQSTKDFLKDNPKQDTLVWAKKMSLSFNLLDVFNGKYILKQMLLKDAIIKMDVDKKGNDNFHFIKTKNDSNKTKFSLDLNKVILNRVNYRFYNTKLSNHFKLYAKRFILSGNLSDDEFGLSTSGSLLLRKIELEKVNYLLYPNTSLNVDIQVNDSKVTVKKGSLKIGDEYLELSGSYWFNKQSYIDLIAKSDQVTIKNILKNLPEKYSSMLNQFDAAGKVAFELFIKGEASKKKSPNIEINAFINNANVLNTNNNISLKNLSFSAHYLSSSSLLEVRGFKGQLYESFAKGDFTIRNFIKPKISANLEIESDLKEIKQFFELDSLQDFHGQVNANIKIKGQLASNQEITKLDIRTFVTSGDIHIKDANVKLEIGQKREFQDINADLHLNNNNIIIDSLAFRFGNSNAKIQGKAYNTLAFILLEGETLNINGHVVCDSLKMSDILSPSNEESQNESFQYPKNIATRLKIEIKQYTYDKFKAQQVYAQFYLDKDKTRIDDFSMKTSGGSASGSLELLPLENKNYSLQLNSNLSDIYIDKIMYQLNDFGQKSISYKNLGGKLTANSQVKAELNSNFSFIKKSLNVISNFVIVNGELKDYEALYSLSKFIELSELEDIKFEQFTNTIEIKNNILYIPKMSISSNAINMEMFGQHDFDNKYKYHLKLLLSEILGRKARKNKKENQEFGFIEDDGKGKTSIFLLIEGDNDKMKIKYDGKSVKAHIKEDFQKEKVNMKSLLNEEFGLFKNDSTITKQKEKPKEKSTKKNFKIEWEDE